MKKNILFVLSVLFFVGFVTNTFASDTGKEPTGKIAFDLMKENIFSAVRVGFLLCPEINVQEFTDAFEGLSVADFLAIVLLSEIPFSSDIDVNITAIPEIKSKLASWLLQIQSSGEMLKRKKNSWWSIFSFYKR